jgi:hypothetical protein
LARLLIETHDTVSYSGKGEGIGTKQKFSALTYKEFFSLTLEFPKIPKEKNAVPHPPRPF